MAYRYYIKNYSLQELELYFESIPSASARTLLKQNRWIWNSTRGCWTTYLSSQAEQIAKSLGAVDGTTPSSNPATNTEKMDLGLIRRSMSETFNAPEFQACSLKEIKAYLNTITEPKPQYIKLDPEYANGFVVLLCDSNSRFTMIGITEDQS